MIIGMKMDIAIRIDTWKNKFKYFMVLAQKLWSYRFIQLRNI